MRPPRTVRPVDRHDRAGHAATKAMQPSVRGITSWKSHCGGECVYLQALDSSDIVEQQQAFEVPSEIHHR